MRSFILILLFLAFSLASIQSCPTLTFFNRSDHATGWIAADESNVLVTAIRFDQNCQGLNQTFPVGTLIVNRKDNGQLVVYKEECILLNLTCGYQDSSLTKLMHSDNILVTFSVSKILISQALIIMQDRGYFEWDDVVSNHWPNFAQNGKQWITVEQLFGNFAGLPYIGSINLSDISMTADLKLLQTLLEEQVPAYASSSDPDRGIFGYSPIVWGWYFYFFSTFVDPLKRNGIDFMKQEIGDPLGVDLHFGIALEDTKTRSKVADMRFGTFPPTPCSSYESLTASIDDPSSLQYRTIYNPPDFASNPLITNTPIGQAVILPAGICFVSASEVAKAILPFTMMGKGSISLASEEAIQYATKTLFNGTDANAFYPSSYTRAGYLKNAKNTIFAPSNKGFGHAGASGSLAFSWDNYTWVYLTADYSIGTCNQGVPFNTYSLYSTFWGWIY